MFLYESGVAGCYLGGFGWLELCQWISLLNLLAVCTLDI